MGSRRRRRRGILHGVPPPDSPDLVALDRFLVGSPPLAPDGRVLSWSGPDAFPYDESTALLARHYAWADQPSRKRHLVAVLEQRVATCGGLERDGLVYAFDTALALPVLGDGRPTALRTVLALLDSRAAAAPLESADRWSRAFAPHLLKAFASLRPEERSPALTLAFRELARETQEGGGFRSHPEHPGIYVHAHCYATEGLWALEGTSEAVRRAVDWLADHQEADGGLPAWVNAPSDRRPADAVAQAARLFAIVDPSRHARQLERALGRLAALQDPVTGGIRYIEGGPHVNVWASIFAHQATRLGRRLAAPTQSLV